MNIKPIILELYKQHKTPLNVFANIYPRYFEKKAIYLAVIKQLDKDLGKGLARKRLRKIEPYNNGERTKDYVIYYNNQCSIRGYGLYARKFDGLHSYIRTLYQ